VVVGEGTGSEAEEGECVSRVPVKINGLKLPSLEEEKEHMLTHLLPRSRCVHCERGKGRSMVHRRSEGKRGVREARLCFFLLGGADGEKTKTVIVAKARDSTMVMASVVPVKGSSHQFPARRVRAFSNELGYEDLDVTLK
jgi:hypothetical protein